MVKRFIPSRFNRRASPESKMCLDSPPLAITCHSTIIVVPTYNESETLALFVERFEQATRSSHDESNQQRIELLIVDDNSPDGTGRLAEQLTQKRPWIHVLHRDTKDGLGMAYRAGFRWCLERGYILIGQMDADLSHPPEKLIEMQAALLDNNADLVLGSRYIPGGGSEGLSTSRLALSRIGCRVSRLILGLPFHDLSGGFKLWSADCLAALSLDTLLSVGYAFQIETTQQAFLNKAQIIEVPFLFSERVAGTSKMSLAITTEGVTIMYALWKKKRHAHLTLVSS